MADCVRENEDDLCAPERWGVVISIIAVLVILCCSTRIQTGPLQRQSVVYIILETASIGITLRAAYVEESGFLLWCASFFGLFEFIFDISCCCGNPARRDGLHSYAATRLLGVSIPEREEDEDVEVADGDDRNSGVNNCLWWTIVMPAICIAVLSPAALIADCVLNDDIPQWATALFGIWEILAATYCVAVTFSFRGYFKPWSPEAVWFLVKVTCIDLPGLVAVLAGYDGGLLAFLFQGIVEVILFCAGVIESNDMIDNVGDLVSFACSRGGLVAYMCCSRRRENNESDDGVAETPSQSTADAIEDSSNEDTLGSPENARVEDEAATE